MSFISKPDQAPTASRRLWLFRPGRASAVETAALEQSIYCPDFGIRQDLSDHLEREMIEDEVREAHPGETEKKLDSLTSQLDTLLNHVMPGDIAICPLPRAGRVAIGMVLPGYATSTEGWPGRRMQWLKTDLARNAFLPDLVHSMGAHQLVCEISRNDALSRIEAVLRSGSDPGPGEAARAGGPPASPDELERQMRARIASRIGAAFAGHDLARLVAAVLEADGYRTAVSPPGPDGGIDILAGRGLTGLDGTRLTVQVKSGDILADHPTLQQLLGAMSGNGSESGLLVAWGGATRAVRAGVAGMWFRVRIWGAADLVEAVLDCHDRLPLDIRDRLGLRKIWIC